MLIQKVLIKVIAQKVNARLVLFLVEKEEIGNRGVA